MKTIALIGDYDPSSPTHAATAASIDHARAALSADVEAIWIGTDRLERAQLDACAGWWIAPGSPYRDTAKVFDAIRSARERGIPCLGTCGGFQHMVIEYARNVLGIVDAAHAEYEQNAPTLFISRLACSLAGRNMKLAFRPGSRVAAAYGCEHADEPYYCNFGVDPARVAALSSGPLQITGADAKGEARVIELPEHPFFVGTLFVPQIRSKPGAPHPLVQAFVRAVSSH